MNAKHILFSLLSTAMLISCGESNSQNKNTDGAMPRSSVNPKAEGGNTCLRAYADKYNELLTKDMAAAASATSAETMTTTNSKTHPEKTFHEVTYSWKTGRKKTVAGLSIPVDDYIRLTGIEAISLERFKMSYKVVTDQEVAALKNKTDEALAGNSDNEAINKRLKELDEMGVSKEEQKKMMEGFSDAARSMTEGFTTVNKIGDTAAWNSKTNSLYVLSNGVKFELVVDLSNASKNLEVATALAKQILDKCP